MTAQLPSKARLAQIASFSKSMALPPSHDEIEAMARALLAAHEQDPLVVDGIFKPGDAVGVFNIGNEFCEDYLVAWTVKGQSLPAGNYWLYTHPAPVPAVPDEIPAGLAGTIISLCAYNVRDKELAQKIYSACRAAMLNGGKS